MRGSNELHSALCNGSGSERFLFRTDLIYDDDLGHVILDGFDHHGMLKLRLGDLHATGATDCRMRYISITRDFVGGIDDDHALLEFFAENACHFAKLGGFPATRASEDQYAAAAFHHVLDYIDGP